MKKTEAIAIVKIARDLQKIDFQRTIDDPVIRTASENAADAYCQKLIEALREPDAFLFQHVS